MGEDGEESRRWGRCKNAFICLPLSHFRTERWVSAPSGGSWPASEHTFLTSQRQLEMERGSPAPHLQSESPWGDCFRSSDQRHFEVGKHLKQKSGPVSLTERCQGEKVQSAAQTARVTIFYHLSKGILNQEAHWRSFPGSDRRSIYWNILFPRCLWKSASKGRDKNPPSWPVPIMFVHFCNVLGQQGINFRVLNSLLSGRCKKCTQN